MRVRQQVDARRWVAGSDEVEQLRELLCGRQPACVRVGAVPVEGVVALLCQGVGGGGGSGKQGHKRITDGEIVVWKVGEEVEIRRYGRKVGVRIGEGTRRALRVKVMGVW